MGRLIGCVFGCVLALLSANRPGYAEAWLGTLGEVLSGSRFTLCVDGDTCREIKLWGIVAPEETMDDIAAGAALSSVWIEDFGYPDDMNIARALLEIAMRDKTVRCAAKSDSAMNPEREGAVVAQCWAISGQPFGDDFESIDLAGFLVQQLAACDLAAVTRGSYVGAYGGKACPKEVTQHLTPSGGQ